jgi:hypothetical protein
MRTNTEGWRRFVVKRDALVCFGLGDERQGCPQPHQGF